MEQQYCNNDNHNGKLNHSNNSNHNDNNGSKSNKNDNTNDNTNINNNNNKNIYTNNNCDNTNRTTVRQLHFLVVGREWSIDHYHRPVDWILPCIPSFPTFEGPWS